jgi:hypothetical protein
MKFIVGWMYVAWEALHKHSQYNINRTFDESGTENMFVGSCMLAQT